MGAARQSAALTTTDLSLPAYAQHMAARAQSPAAGHLFPYH